MGSIEYYEYLEADAPRLIGRLVICVCGSIQHLQSSSGCRRLLGRRVEHQCVESLRYLCFELDKDPSR